MNFMLSAALKLSLTFCIAEGGSNADIVIVDSYVKKLKGVDWNQAYKAVVKDAEEQPPNWDVEGRGGLASWKSVGYIPYHDDDTGGMRTRSVSRTLEYAYNGKQHVRTISMVPELNLRRFRHRPDGQCY